MDVAALPTVITLVLPVTVPPQTGVRDSDQIRNVKTNLLKPLQTLLERELTLNEVKRGRSEHFLKFLIRAADTVLLQIVVN